MKSARHADAYLDPVSSGIYNGNIPFYVWLHVNIFNLCLPPNFLLN